MSQDIFQPSGSIGEAERSHLKAVEEERLQCKTFNSPLYSALDIGTPRYDWRSRASSRTRLAMAGEYHDGHGLNRRRIAPPQVPVQMGELFFAEIKAYADRFLPLIDAEQQQEEAKLKQRLSNWSLDRLKHEGYCLTGMAAFWLEKTQFGRPVASFMLGPGVVLPDHKFDNGTQVLVSRIDPLKEEPLSGNVVGCTMTHIRVAFEGRFELDEPSWRLDVGRSNIIFDRMRTAISHFNHNPLSLEHSDSSSDLYIFQGTHLRDVLLRTFSPAFSSTHAPLQAADDVNYISHETLEHKSRESEDHNSAFMDDMRVRSWAKRYLEVNPVRVEGDPVLSGLNATQTRAVAMMIGERISLVQGPPGTGKTKTIIETIKLLKVHFEVVHPLLVCTFTNVAVDNLVEGFVAVGVKALRIAFGGNVKPSLFEHTLDYKFDQHLLKPNLDKLAQEERALDGELGALEKRIFELEKTGRYQSRLDRMRANVIFKERQRNIARAKKYVLKQKMLRQILAAADVICTTCITSAANALNVIDFPVVFLDEASMSTEPASLIPIMKGSQHVALIGDHKQLPPVITSSEALAKGLGISLFERLTKEGVVPSIMLDVQYRMHPSISRFPSSEFYNFALRDGTVDSNGEPLLGLTPPMSSHLQEDTETGKKPSVVFLDHAGPETTKDRSRVNHKEAGIVVSIVVDLLSQNENLRGEDIGIIAPYVGQVSLLKRMLEVDTNRENRARFEETLGSLRILQLKDIEVKTVDGFEGREKEVIIFSTVRNNAGGYIGFLADRRRLNVGLTRAKRGLFVVGSMSTLKVGKMSQGTTADGQTFARVGKGAQAWRRYAEFLSQEKMVIRLDGKVPTRKPGLVSMKVWPG